MIVHTHITQHTNLQNCLLNDVVSTPVWYTSTCYLYQWKVLKFVTGASVHWTYSSSCSSAILDQLLEANKHSRSSISSVVELARFLVNHGGIVELAACTTTLTNLTIPECSIWIEDTCSSALSNTHKNSHCPQKKVRVWCCHYHMDIDNLDCHDFQWTSH